ncbi:hypothetical protein PC129_g4638 [Phytophthora cactorum]|uniref:Uncharacterized protein n=1 Tax=Phytophthora cactorum TaxID=29920 RepID=A0A329S1C6_9STRA|nr:hypothetical protein Pcac1_g7835 [Phytophthora cactorum]KAG2918459.1 hypothetical protein PC114_g6823 [Phytophthora cactorum]KAG2947639.1 hypothetical protein PC117_g6655 [Phytophthora cactorum]KAG3030278.1 hypothetical protein PC119_g6297 [Phytophthora cactorum]KAG3094172.1 hypothetical protein PC122_g5856 [Phytophthora cactorum]
MGRFIMRESMRFEWDGRAGRVSSMDRQSDMLTPLLHLLGRLEDMRRVFQSALVTPDCRLLAHANQ